MFDDPEYTTHVMGFLVHVTKDGGGTLGRRYHGTWTVTVMDGDVYLMDNEIMVTGTAKNHEEVAEIAYDYAMYYMAHHRDENEAY